MSRPERRVILKMCCQCESVLACDFPEDPPVWTLYEPAIEQAQLELKKGSYKIEKVESCEVCQGKDYISVLS